MRVPVGAYWQVPVRRSSLPGVALLGAVTAVLGVAACTGQTNSFTGQTESGTGQTNNGTVYGSVFGSGGPLKDPSRNLSSPRPMKNLTVIAARVHSSTKFATVTSNDGTFSLSVASGTYILEAACGKAEPPVVRVPPGAKVKRDIHCQFV